VPLSLLGLGHCGAEPAEVNVGEAQIGGKGNGHYTREKPKPTGSDAE